MAMLDVEAKSKVLEAEEILQNVQEIRKIQREFINSSNPEENQIAKDFFEKSFANFLKNSELAKRKANNTISSEMQQEGLEQFEHISDKFFLYPKKSHQLVPNML